MSKIFIKIDMFNSFPIILTLLLILLKLSGFIEWSWWWVFSPTLIPLGIVLAGVSYILILLTIVRLLR